MDEALPVGVFQRAANALHHLGGRLGIQRSMAALVKAILERAALYILHRDIVIACGLPAS